MLIQKLRKLLTYFTDTIPNILCWQKDSTYIHTKNKRLKKIGPFVSIWNVYVS